MSSSESRYSFNWGYTEKGFADKVYHLHLRYEGDNDELYFRDYLNENPLYAKEYECIRQPSAILRVKENERYEFTGGESYD